MCLCNSSANGTENFEYKIGLGNYLRWNNQSKYAGREGHGISNASKVRYSPLHEQKL